MALLLVLIGWVFRLYSVAIIARALLPWFKVDYYHPAMRLLIRITEPLLAPLRRHIQPMGGLDFTPMVALLILWIAELIVTQLIRTLALMY